MILRPRLAVGLSGALWCAGLLCCTGAGARGATPDAISPAETLLFNTNHWQALRAPATLVYDFSKSGSAEPAFADQVRVDVSQLNADHTAVVAVHFLSGARQRDMPTLDHAEGNPVLLAFLERDIAEMTRLTGGKAPYFRRRIRLALAEAAQVRPVTIRYHGKQLPAQEIRSQPYLNDPMHARFEQYTGKSYVFVLSPQIDGGLYQIRTLTAGAGQPLMEETLTLVGEEDAQHGAKR